MKRIQTIAMKTTLLLLFIPVFAQADNLNVEMMRATFKLSNKKSTATAFLLKPSSTALSKKGQSILVTAAHVFEKMTGNEATLFVRRQESDGVYTKVPVKLQIRKAGKDIWTKHPTEDVAAIYVQLPKEADRPNLSLDLLATDKTLKRYEIHPGDNLMCLGYPHRVEANKAGFPILRNGPIASFPLLPTKNNKTFLMSMNTFEGDSGSPVYLAESNRQVGDKKQEVRLILGLVIGQHFLDEEAKLIYGTTKLRHRSRLGDCGACAIHQRNH